jgi:hypothetical protein
MKGEKKKLILSEREKHQAFDDNIKFPALRKICFLYINISKFYQFSWCWVRACPSFASVYFLPDGASLQKLTR